MSSSTRQGRRRWWSSLKKNKKKLKTTFQSRPAIQLNEISLLFSPTKRYQTRPKPEDEVEKKSHCTPPLNCKRQRDSHHHQSNIGRERWSWMQVQGILCNFVIHPGLLLPGPEVFNWLSWCGGGQFTEQFFLSCRRKGNSFSFLPWITKSFCRS